MQSSSLSNHHLIGALYFSKFRIISYKHFSGDLQNPFQIHLRLGVAVGPRVYTDPKDLEWTEADPNPTYGNKQLYNGFEWSLKNWTKPSWYKWFFVCQLMPVSPGIPFPVSPIGFARDRQVAWEKLEQWNSDHDAWVTMWELDVPLAMKFERPGETVSWFSELYHQNNM